MITETQKDVFKRFRRFYFYLEAQPFYWKPDFSGLEFKTEKMVWIKWILGQLILWSYVPILIYVAATHLIIIPRPGLDIIKLADYFGLSFGIWGIQAVAFVVLYNFPSFAQGNNAILEFERLLLKFTNSTVKTSNKITIRQIIQENLFDWTVIFLVLLGAVAPALVVTLCLYLDFDGYYFLFQDVFPDLEYITMNHIICSMLIRAILDTIVAAEFTRLATFLITIFLIYINSAKNILKNLAMLSLNGLRTESLIRLYTSIYLIFNVIHERLDRILCIAFSASFLSSVPALWVSTKKYGLVDELLYYFTTLLAVFLVLIPLMIFELFINVRKTSLELLTCMREKAMMAKNKRHTKKTGWELREIKVLRKISFGFGTFFEMDTEAIVSYFMQLLDKWVTAILLF